MGKTNEAHLIEMLQKETKLSLGGVLELFQIINKYDWAVFCSYMDDYDHPEERVQAKKVLDEKLSHYQENDWKKVWSLLNENGEIHSFYNNYFHTMKEEYKK
jgi:hypothetical protein